jgi:chromosome segregation ATPase
MLHRDEVKNALEEKRLATQELQKKLDSTERRSTKLKDYIARLTDKCEGWNESYNHQTTEFDEVRDQLVASLSKSTALEQDCRKLQEHNGHLQAVSF